MHIIIVGCGKVGRTLAEQLQEEDIDLTVIDTVEKTVNDVTEGIDAMGIVGNGAQHQYLNGCRNQHCGYSDRSNCF